MQTKLTNFGTIETTQKPEQNTYTLLAIKNKVKHMANENTLHTLKEIQKETGMTYLKSIIIYASQPKEVLENEPEFNLKNISINYHMATHAKKIL